jgi:hypothetical protein
MEGDKSFDQNSTIHMKPATFLKHDKALTLSVFCLQMSNRHRIPTLQFLLHPKLAYHRSSQEGRSELNQWVHRNYLRVQHHSVRKI